MPTMAYKGPIYTKLRKILGEIQGISKVAIGGIRCGLCRQSGEEKGTVLGQREEDENIADLDNVQAMMNADYELAARLQAEEQGELTIKEKSRLFVELMNKRKNHFARLRAEKQRRKPPTKAQKRNTIVNTFVDMDIELVKGSETRTKGSSKKAGEELKSENLKKQKLDENVEAEVDDDQEEAEMKKHMEIVPDDEVAIDGILSNHKS
ncbi:hypothetical protein Tco_1538297 [Tanacetum coccineum]